MKRTLLLCLLTSSLGFTALSEADLTCPPPANIVYNSAKGTWSYNAAGDLWSTVEVIGNPSSTTFHFIEAMQWPLNNVDKTMYCAYGSVNNSRFVLTDNHAYVPYGSNWSGEFFLACQGTNVTDCLFMPPINH